MIRSRLSLITLIALLLASVPVFAENNGGQYQFFIPTRFQNNDKDSDGSERYDAQRLREKRDSLSGIGARVAEFKELLANQKPGDPFVLRWYFPHDKPEKDRQAEIAALKKEWEAEPGLKDFPLLVEEHFLDRLPRNITKEDAKAAGLPESIVEEANAQPKPTQNAPKGFFSWLKQPSTARASKPVVAAGNTATLGAFRTYLLTHYGTQLPNLWALATLAVDLPVDYLSKRFQIPFSTWLATHGLPLASKIGGPYERASLWYQKQGSAKLFLGYLGLFFTARPALIDFTSRLALGKAAGVDPAFWGSLAIGGGVLLPSFLYGYSGYERLRQKGYISGGERTLKLLRGASVALFTLIAASSGIDSLRYLLPLTVAAEYIPYIYTGIVGRRRAPIHNRFVLVDKELSQNPIDLNDLEALEVTRDITGKEAAPIVAEAKEKWKEIEPPKPSWLGRQLACHWDKLVAGGAGAVTGVVLGETVTRARAAQQ